MAASICGIRWRAGTAILDPSILDRKRGGFAHVTDVRSTLHCVIQKHTLVFFSRKCCNRVISQSDEVCQQDTTSLRIQPK